MDVGNDAEAQNEAPEARKPRSCRVARFSQSSIRDTLACTTPPEEVAMAIVLNHTIVPAHDKAASAEFFARVFGLEYKGPHSHFAPVQVNDGLTLDFDERGQFEPHHYAFMVSEAEFDAIFDRIKAEGISYGSGPRSRTDGQINHRRGGRGVYFDDPNGHVLEILTA
jgi:catechol 2,3-dioxygenase-like lactoylglutathione lyase family enzyme